MEQMEGTGYKRVFSKDFIHIIDDFYSSDECNQVINHFKNLKSNGFYFRQKDALRTDEQISIIEDNVLVNSAVIGKSFCDRLHNGPLLEYTEEYPILKNISALGIMGIKIQRTVPGGGFHNFHYENFANGSSDRVGVFMLYLNDVKNGGETEFIYQHMRIEPKAGRLVIWPSGFTHTHRGNPPLSEEKYILTGWIESQPMYGQY